MNKTFMEPIYLFVICVQTFVQISPKAGSFHEGGNIKSPQTADGM